MYSSPATGQDPQPHLISSRGEFTNRRQPSCALANGRGRANRDVRRQSHRAMGRGVDLTSLSMEADDADGCLRRSQVIGEPFDGAKPVCAVPGQVP